MTMILWYLAIGAIVAAETIWYMNRSNPKKLEELMEPVYRYGNVGVIVFIAMMMFMWPYNIVCKIKSVLRYFKKSGPD